MSDPKGKKIFTLLLALLAWVGLILQLWLMMDNRQTTGISTVTVAINFFSYFTILSNLLVALTLTLPLIKRDTLLITIRSRSAIALYIFIVGLVYNTVLRAAWQPDGLQLIVDNILHVAVPLLYLVWWLLYTPRYYLHWRDLLPWLVLPLFYLVYSLIRGSIVNWYPYPFLNAGIEGYGRVAINSFFVLLAFLIVGLGLIAVNRAGNRQNVK